MAVGRRERDQQVSHGRDCRTTGALPVFFAPFVERTVSWLTNLRKGQAMSSFNGKPQEAAEMLSGYGTTMARRQAVFNKVGRMGV